MMDKKELEKKLRDLQIPEPDLERKAAAIQAAMDEFERAGEGAREKIKGSMDERRPTGRSEKKPHKGGFIMWKPVGFRPVLVTAALGVIIVAVTVTVMGPGLDKMNTEVIRDVETPASTVPGPATSPDASKDAPPMHSMQDRKGSQAVKGQDAENAPRTRPSEVKVDERRSEVSSELGKESDKLASAEKTARAKRKPGEPAPAKMRKDFDAFGKLEARSAAPVPPRGAYSMEYEEQIPFDQREYSGRDRFEHLDANPVKVVAKEPVSTFSVDVDTASYAFVRRALNQGHLPQKDSVRVEELINYFDYDYARPVHRQEPFKPTVALYPTPWNPATKLLHIGIKGHEDMLIERPRANLVFLIDVSGSMSSPDKLPLLKNSLKMLVEELEPEDTVAIAVYAGSAGTVLEPTKVKDKGRIIAALDRLKSGGSTAGGAGIKLAYSLAESNFDPGAVNRVILATDGDFNVGIRSNEELKGFIERKRDTGVYLSILGFGQGNYNDHLMQKLAQNGNGNAAYIDTLSEARKVLVDEAGSTLYTIARDVKIQIEFNPERVSEYRLIGYESRILRREDFNNDRVDAGDIGAGHSVTAIYELTLAGSGAEMVDPLRYGKGEVKGKTEKAAKGEYAFLKIRYKLPDEDTSRLIETPVDSTVEFSSIDSAGDDIRFAASVAAFGQLLKGGTYMKTFGYSDVLRLAEGSRGADLFGYRSEFLKLARLAMTASTMGVR